MSENSDTPEALVDTSPDRDRADPLDSFLGDHFFPLKPASLLESAPPRPGVVTLWDKDKIPLLVEWADSVESCLRRYVERIPAVRDIATRARYFDVLPTSDRGQLAKVFDRLVDRRGTFPLLMTQAPPGAHNTVPAPEAIASGQARLVPDCRESSDEQLIVKLRELAEISPSDPKLQDWLAYALYSNNLLDEVIAVCTRFIRSGTLQQSLFYYCANALYKQGKKKAALEFWQAVVKIDGLSTMGQKAAKRAASVRMGDDPEITLF